MVFDGYCNRKVFESYIEYCLLPVLKKGQTVIADNASFHKSKKARELIESAGCFFKFLPAYSPDFNPIEHYWFTVKNKIRKLLDKGKEIFEASCKSLSTMYEPMR